MLIGLGLVVAEGIIAIMLIRKPKLIEINVDGVVTTSFENRKKLRVTFVVLASISAFFVLISIFIGSPLSILILVLFATIISLESVVLSLKNEAQITNQPSENSTNATTSATSSPTNPAKSMSIEEKIAELKHLLELGVITQEQYEVAIERIIKSAT